MLNGVIYEGPFEDTKKHGIGMLHSNGQTTRVEYRENVFVRNVDQNEEIKSESVEENK